MTQTAYRSAMSRSTSAPTSHDFPDTGSPWTSRLTPRAGIVTGAALPVAQPRVSRCPGERCTGSRPESMGPVIAAATLPPSSPGKDPVGALQARGSSSARAAAPAAGREELAVVLGVAQRQDVVERETEVA